MITPNQTLFLIIDVQGKLARTVHQPDALESNIKKMIRACHVLEVPIVVTEQYPKGLGHTIEPVMELLGGCEPVEKLSFSCCGTDDFMKKLRSFNRNDILIAGIETHVCVYQTAVELLDFGYNVHLLSDAVSSRSEENKLLGIRCIEKAGASVTSSEMAIFELLRIAEGDRFKAISKIVKE